MTAASLWRDVFTMPAAVLALNGRTERFAAVAVTVSCCFAHRAAPPGFILHGARLICNAALYTAATPSFMPCRAARDAQRTRTVTFLCALLPRCILPYRIAAARRYVCHRRLPARPARAAACATGRWTTLITSVYGHRRGRRRAGDKRWAIS